MKKIREFITLEERWQKEAFFNLARSKIFYTDKLAFISSSVHLILWGYPTHKKSHSCKTVNFDMAKSSLRHTVVQVRIFTVTAWL